MAPRSPARWLAPLALAAAALALIVILGSSAVSSDPSPETSPTIAPSTDTKRKRASRTSTTARKARTGASGASGATGATGADEDTYTVQSGDFLSTVAEKTGVPIERLRELNPGLDANSMTVGQEIKLRP